MKKKEQVMYKTVTYFTKTNRPHKVSITYTHNNRFGCSFNSAQGAWRFTAIATPNEIESWHREIENNKPAVRIVRGKRTPNRHQRKHGMV